MITEEGDIRSDTFCRLDDVFAGRHLKSLPIDLDGDEFFTRRIQRSFCLCQLIIRHEDVTSECGKRAGGAEYLELSANSVPYLWFEFAYSSQALFTDGMLR
jgi:hypothetical protein